MIESAGDPEFPVWLVADSPPKNWGTVLDTPLDPGHPARHNIWTSVLEYMQEALYRRDGRRFDTARLYVRYAVSKRADKPDRTSPDWPIELRRQINIWTADLMWFRPKVILTFGAFTFEFLRRAHNENPWYPFTHWTTGRLGDDFRERYKSIDLLGVNILPLLHRNISGGRFMESHRDFMGEQAGEGANYFEYVGTKLAELSLERLAQEPIWIQ